MLLKSQLTLQKLLFFNLKFYELIKNNMIGL